MKLALLLSTLDKVKEIEVEKRIHKDGTQVYIFSSLLPFPHPQQYEPAWYVIVVRPGQKPGEEEIDDDEVEAMLQHLWMFQLDIPIRTDPNAN
jgi:hypothetical protein